MRQYNNDGIPYIENKIIPAMLYMGNKRKLATKILNSIYNTIGDFDTLYDLFGGGGSVSVAGLLAGHKVIYNEYNTGISNLMQYIKDGKVWFMYKDDDGYFDNYPELGSMFYNGLIRKIKK